MNLMKKLSIGLIATTMSVAAHAGFMTIGGAGGFTEATTAGTDQIAGVSLITGQVPVDSVSWGTPINDGQSSLLLVDEPVQSIDVLDQNYLLSTLTHFNKPIDGAAQDFLSTATIVGMLNLTGSFSSPVPPSIPTIFDIQFKETSNNVTDSQPLSYCNVGDNDEDGIAGGAQHDHGTKCDDRFDYTVDGGSFPFYIPLSIVGLGDFYLTIFAATDIAGNDVVTSNRFWTPENQDTSIYTFARLTKVPEPASIAILGLGLLGLAASRKRKS